MPPKKLHIKKDFCKSCGLCINACKFRALKLSEEFNESGCHPVELVGECKACGRCYLVCPDFAIEIKEDKND